MFDHTHYVPILKAKEGEFGALQTLDASVKNGLTPVIEAQPIPSGQPVKQYAQRLVEDLVTSWGTDRPFFLDFRWVSEPPTRANEHPFRVVLDFAGEAGLKVIPVTGLDRSPLYQKAVKRAATQSRDGICIRLEGDDFDDDDLPEALDELLGSLELPPKQVDIILDFREVIPGQASSLTLAARGVLYMLPHVRAWRTLTVTATAFPVNLASYGPNTTNTRERTEWVAWSDLVAKAKRLPRIPTFGDYGIAHPDLPPEFDPAQMRMSAQIRYTSDTSWLILKGRDAIRYGFEQFNDLCRILVTRREYCGPSFSWGDKFIYEASKRNDRPGNASIWRKVGTSHHLTLVARQLSNMFAP